MLNRYSPQTLLIREGLTFNILSHPHLLLNPNEAEGRIRVHIGTRPESMKPGRGRIDKQSIGMQPWLSLSGHGLFVTHLWFQGAQRWRQPPPGGSHWLHTAAHGGFIVLNINVHMSSIVMLLFYFLKLFRWVSGLYTFLLKTIRKSKICVVFCHDGFA